MSARENHEHPGFASSAVPARYLRDLVSHLTQQGYPVAATLKRAGLSVPLLNHPRARIDRRQLTVALQGLVTTTRRSDLGFEMGLLINIATADVVGQMLLSSATLAEGLSRVSQYFALLTPSFRMHVDRTSGRYLVSCEPSMPLPYDMALMGLETLAVGLHRLMLFLLQEKSAPGILDASWPAPEHVARYRELKGLRTRFGVSSRPCFTLSIAADVANEPLPMANPAAVKEAERSCKRLLEELRRSATWTSWVTRMLQGVEGTFPTQRELAEFMRLSTRTFVRYLAEEGCSYRALAGEIRHQRAQDLLACTDKSLLEIAQTLGYSDAANFSRAFKQVAQMNPGAYREAMKRSGFVG